MIYISCDIIIYGRNDIDNCDCSGRWLGGYLYSAVSFRQERA